MTSSYTQNLTLEEPGNGDYNNTWSTPLNSNFSILDQAVGGRSTINVVGASGTIALASTTYRNRIIVFSGTLTANVNYQIPSGVGGFWFMFNNTTGSFTVTVSSAGGGTSLVLPQTYTSAVICDGTDVGLASTAPVPLATTATTADSLNTSNDYTVTNLTATRYYAGDGSVSAPSYGFGSDIATDTGFYWIADGQIGITCNGTFVGSIVYGGNLSMTGNVTAYSDRNLKTDLNRITGALDKIEKLTGYVYTRVDTGARQTGLIAQDVQAVLPEAVDDSGEHLALAYGNLLGLVVEAIKELREEVDCMKWNLREDIDSLKRSR